MVAKKSRVVSDIARERIAILYGLARADFDTEPELSRRYVKLMKEISRHYKIKLDKHIKNGICKRCNSVLIPGKSVSVKIASSKSHIIYRCKNCGHEAHIHY